MTPSAYLCLVLLCQSFYASFHIFRCYFFPMVNDVLNNFSRIKVIFSVNPALLPEKVADNVLRDVLSSVVSYLKYTILIKNVLFISR